MGEKRRIKILVVDDSLFMREIISDMLSENAEIQVIGTARDGEEALRMVKEMRPDVITLDVEMPRMNGLFFLEEMNKEGIMIPVVMLSAHTREGTFETLRALEMGAVDFVAKPSDTVSLNIRKVKDELIQKVLLASRVRHEHLKSETWKSYEEGKKFLERKAILKSDEDIVIVIGASTGGAKALCIILPFFLKDFPAPILVVQHMPEGFTKSLAERLDALCSLKVKEASHGDYVCEGTIFIAPGNFHMRIDENKRICLSQEETHLGVRPSVDILMSSVATVYGSGTIGVILTGMGHDGALGIKKIKEKNGIVFSQDRETSVVFGMPKAAIQTGAVDFVLPLNKIPQEIVRIINSKRSKQN